MPHVRIGDKTVDISQSGDKVTIDGMAVDVSLHPLSNSTFLLLIDGRPRVVTVEPNEENTTVTLAGQSIETHYLTDAEMIIEELGMETGMGETHREIRAPMPGLLLRVLVETGERVAKGQGLVVLEAMKMENELSAPTDGVVAAIPVAEGAPVAKNDLLVELN